MNIDALKDKLEGKSPKTAKDVDKSSKVATSKENSLKATTIKPKAANSSKKGAKSMKKLEKGNKSVAKVAKTSKNAPNSNQKETIMDHAKAREMAKEVLAEVAKANVKTHHLGRDGTWLICDKTNEVQAGISKKGTTGLVKVTMPIDKLPKAAQEHGKKAVQAFHMTWLQFNISRNVLKAAINARVNSRKTSKDFSTDVYGTPDAPCWNKGNAVKATAEDKLKALNARKVKLAQQEKDLKAEIKARKATKAPKAKATNKTATATA